MRKIESTYFGGKTPMLLQEVRDILVDSLNGSVKKRPCTGLCIHRWQVIRKSVSGINIAEMLWFPELLLVGRKRV
jgi:hypothetical protein